MNYLEALPKSFHTFVALGLNQQEQVEVQVEFVFPRLLENCQHIFLSDNYERLLEIVDDEASILGGQWAGYLRDTFAEYRSGEREQPKKMAEKLDPLSDADIEALVHYYASQQ